MKRSELLDAVVDKKMQFIKYSMTYETYLREALRYGITALVDVSNEELYVMLDDYKLTVEDIR
jgi:hypothetical protein